ncbi:uncharacterized protein [Triticum aestivum]|uniref:uncharacterized protein n=1 Tax=Triticum aestivum TaxID=4565 RepID=UPI001D02D878|nr:uncharacterized protein LOC123081987 [Triticum aestivum]
MRSASSPRHETLSILSVIVRFIICVHELEPASTPSPGSSPSSSSDRPHLAVTTAAPVHPRGNRGVHKPRDGGGQKRSLRRDIGVQEPDATVDDDYYYSGGACYYMQATDDDHE